MITSVYAALLGLIFVALSLYVIKGRKQSNAALGDAGDMDLTRRIRAQGNFAEYAPFCLILLGFAEYGGLPVYGVHLGGIFLTLGRVMHAYSLLKHERYSGSRLLATPGWRMAGMILTFTVITALSISILIQHS